MLTFLSGFPVTAFLSLLLARPCASEILQPSWVSVNLCSSDVQELLMTSSWQDTWTWRYGWTRGWSLARSSRPCFGLCQSVSSQTWVRSLVTSSQGWSNNATKICESSINLLRFLQLCLYECTDNECACSVHFKLRRLAHFGFWKPEDHFGLRQSN